jgi:DNA repair photolyase
MGMRWDGQKIQDEQALPGLTGLTRSVTSPDFDGVTFHEIRAKSVLNKVSAVSTMPFRWTVNPYRGCSHACAYCLDGSTLILMANGKTKALEEVRVGDEIYGTRRVNGRRRYVRTEVLAHWSTMKLGYRVTLADGTCLITSGEHRFLTDRGWKYVADVRTREGRRPRLAVGDKLMGTGVSLPVPADKREYRAGYLRAVASSQEPASDVRERSRCYASDFASLDELKTLPYRSSEVSGRDAAEVKESDLAWDKGFLAGIFDTQGCFSARAAYFSHLDFATAQEVCRALDRFSFSYSTRTLRGSEPQRTVRITGGVTEQLRFLQLTNPLHGDTFPLSQVPVTSSEQLAISSIEPLGLELPLYDITTGTGDFLAGGVVSHNCFARNTHTYLDFDAGRDFDTQVVVKVNAPEVLTAQLARPSWKREHVAMGTNTDPYQRAEGKYQLMPGIIKALAHAGTPFSILTKGTMLSRDLPLLTAVQQEVSVSLGVSLALTDHQLQRRLEPGTPSPRARLHLIRNAREAGISCGVVAGPILPGLTDSVEALDSLFAAIAEAGATGVTVLPLHLRPGAREWFAAWLKAEHPELVPRYRQIYAKGSYAAKPYRQWLSQRVASLLRRHGLAPHLAESDHQIPDEGSVEGTEIPSQRTESQGTGKSSTSGSSRAWRFRNEDFLDGAGRANDSLGENSPRQNNTGENSADSTQLRLL